MTESPLKGCFRKFTPELRSERVLYIQVGCAGSSSVIKKMDTICYPASGSFGFVRTIWVVPRN